MKMYTKNIRTFLILFSSILLFSCNEDNGAEELFEENPTERLNQEEQELRNLLVSSENGWKATYFTNDEELGGWTFIFDFTDSQNVTMVSDFSENTLEPKTSEYDIIIGSTIKLSFSTNNYIHNLSDSNNYPDEDFRGRGYMGDFEFLYYGQEGEDLIFRSNRLQKEVRFTKATQEDWNTIEENRETIPLLNQSVYSKLIINENGDEEIFNFDFSYSRRFASVTNPEVFGRDISFGVAPKPNGIVISPGIEVDGQTVTEFVYDEASQNFVGVVEGGSSVIITFPTEPSTITDDYQLIGTEITGMAYLYPFLYSNPPHSYNFLQLFDEANDALMEDDLYVGRVQMVFEGNLTQISYMINDFTVDSSSGWATETNVARVDYTATWTINNESKLVVSSTGNWSGDTQYRSLFEDINDMMTTNQGLIVEMSDLTIYYSNDILTLTSSEDPSMRIAFYVF